MSARKASVLELATAAYDLEASVTRGHLHRSTEGKWTVSGADVEAWLAQYEGQEIVLIAASLDDKREVQPRTCPQCGREYVGAYCPHCHGARMRLRGR
jgi:hypothetical protein